MLTFLFWNINERPRLPLLTRLVERHDVDVVMLAESRLGVADVLTRLSSKRGSAFHHNGGNCEKISIFSRFEARRVRPIVEDHRMSIRRFQPAGCEELLLAVVHLRSKLHQSEASQAIASTEVAGLVARAEEKAGHNRTLLVGDLNMNPFEAGIVGAGGLHATMDRRIAARERRTIGSKAYEFFYNPMWSLLGDASRGPPGTYHYRQSEQVAYFWHMFDQVLVRPSLLSAFRNEDLTVLESDGETSLLNRSGAPDPDVGSDHLPILFRLGSPHR